MEGLTKTIPPFSSSFSIPLPNSLSPPHPPLNSLLSHFPAHSVSDSITGFPPPLVHIFPWECEMHWEYESSQHSGFWGETKKASLSLSKQILWLSSTCADRISLVADVTLLQGLDGVARPHVKQQTTAWHYLTHCYQDGICFPLKWAPQAIREVWLNSRDVLL